MPQPPTTIVDELGIALSNLADAATGAFTPTLRLGVTGLSRAGKTIFMTSHVFEEVQRCCDQVGIIREGRLVTVQPARALTYTRQKVYHITFEDIHQAAAFAQEWETGVELLRNRVIVAVPASPQVLLKTLTKYTVLDLVGGREELESSFLRSFGGDLV